MHAYHLKWFNNPTQMANVNAFYCCETKLAQLAPVGSVGSASDTID